MLRPFSPGAPRARRGKLIHIDNFVFQPKEMKVKVGYDRNLEQPG